MHGLSYDLRGNQRSDQKITDQLIMLLLYLTSLLFGVDDDKKNFLLKAFLLQKHFFCDLQNSEEYKSNVCH